MCGTSPPGRLPRLPSLRLSPTVNLGTARVLLAAGAGPRLRLAAARDGRGCQVCGVWLLKERPPTPSRTGIFS